MEAASGDSPHLLELSPLLSHSEVLVSEEKSYGDENLSSFPEGSSSGTGYGEQDSSTSTKNVSEEAGVRGVGWISGDGGSGYESRSGQIHETSEQLSRMERDMEGLAEKKQVDLLVRYLYCSHFLSRWGDRMWEFAVGLFMIEVWPNSLLLAAIYGLVEAASVAAMGVVVGGWVDKRPGLRVVQISLGVQNGSVVAAALAVVVLLLHPGSAPGGFKAFIALVVLVNTFGAFGALAGLASNIIVERDWVVVIAESQSPGLLTGMNAVMRRIDLSCKLLAPVAVGFLMSSVSVISSAVFIAVWNIASVGLEYWFLYSVYMGMPGLQCKAHTKGTVMETPVAGGFVESWLVGQEESGRVAKGKGRLIENENIEDEEEGLVQGKLMHSKSWSNALVHRLQHLPVIEGWGVYMRQEAMLAGLALALLYFTVLSFGTLMTAVLKWRGLPPYILGLARGGAALVGILATVVYPSVHARLQTIRTGLWSIWLQCSLLSLCVASIWVRSSSVAAGLLIGGVSASRLGLWMFDLSVTQLMQESVPEAERGVVGGVQNSLQAIMDMLTYAMGMVVSHPQDFGIPISFSFGAVFLAATLYSVHVYHVRGHLLHLDRLFRSH